jgi:hypothetical protein
MLIVAKPVIIENAVVFLLLCHCLLKGYGITSEMCLVHNYAMAVRK